jgi:hypothetical protein
MRQEPIESITTYTFYACIILLVVSGYITWTLSAPFFGNKVGFEGYAISSLFCIGLGCLFFLIGWYLKSKKNNIAFVLLAISATPSIMMLFPVFKGLIFESSQTVTAHNEQLVFDNGQTNIITVMMLDFVLLRNDTFVSAKITGHGGDTASAFRIKELLRNEGIKRTIAYGKECNSACTIIWTAGKERIISDMDYLGFHRSCYVSKECEIKAYLYDGFLTEELINIIASPNGEHICPIGNNEVSILEKHGESQTKKDLINKLRIDCLNKGGIKPI